MTIKRARFRPVRLAAALLCGALAQAEAWADNGIFLCVDENGKKQLTNEMKKGCRQLTVPGSIPAPETRRSETRPLKPATPTPADFPRVDTGQQKARDNDRREILNEELRSEERKLADLRREFNNGEPERNGNERNFAKYQERVEQMRAGIRRSEQNVEALNREISNIR